MSTFIGRMGYAEVTVPVGSRIAVYSPSPVKLYGLAGLPNHPGEWTLVTTTTAGQQVISTAMTSVTKCKIVASEADAWYEVGTAPFISDRAVLVGPQGAPSALVGVDTLTPAILQNGIVTLTHAAGATVALTLATGAALDAAVSMDADEYFDWHLINLSAAAIDTGTVTASAGHTIVGNAVVASSHATTVEGASATFRTRKTAANTFVTYRLG